MNIGTVHLQLELVCRCRATYYIHLSPALLVSIQALPQSVLPQWRPFPCLPYVFYLEPLVSQAPLPPELELCSFVARNTRWTDGLQLGNFNLLT